MLNTSRPSIPQGASLGKLSNGWTDWHQMCHASAYPSWNEHTPNKLPLETQGGAWGLGVKHSKVWGSCQMVGPIGTNFTSADSSGNEHRLNRSRPSIPQGALWVGGHKLKSIGKLLNGCTDWHHILYTSADLSGSGHRLNKIRPTIPQAHFWGL